MFNHINDIERMLNDPDSPELKLAHAYMDRCEKEYQSKNPCPKCRSHATHLEPIAIDGAKSSWVEYCDDCGWELVTDCGCGDEKEGCGCSGC